MLVYWRVICKCHKFGSLSPFQCQHPTVSFSEFFGTTGSLFMPLVVDKSCGKMYLAPNSNFQRSKHGQKGSTFIDFLNFLKISSNAQKQNKSFMWQLAVKQKRLKKSWTDMVTCSECCFVDLFHWNLFFKVKTASTGALGEQWSVARRQILHLSRKTSSRYTP